MHDTTKKVLILGTSHSQATCANDGETPMVFHSGRWHDYFADDLGWEVTNLSRSSITAHQQLEVITKYFIDNPDVHFDLAILEGRSMETNSSMPQEDAEYDNNTLWQWMLESPDESEAVYAVDRMTPGETKPNQRTARFLPWYSEYLMSMQHAIDVFSINLAMLNILQRHSDNTRWFCIGANSSIPDDHKTYNLGKYMLSEYLFKTTPVIDGQSVDLWPALHNPSFYQYREQDFKCDCNHMNLRGHKYLWDNLIKPEVQHIFKEIT